jgi:hypothetical protein
MKPKFVSGWSRAEHFPYATGYTLGYNACGNCQAGKHQRCRVKLDDTLCSCSCPAAAQLRLEYEDEVEFATVLNRPIPGPREAVKRLRPGSGHKLEP